MKKLIMMLMFLIFICMAPQVMAQDSIESGKDSQEQKPGGVKSLEVQIVSGADRKVQIVSRCR
jgi:hypothetical protein